VHKTNLKILFAIPIILAAIDPFPLSVFGQCSEHIYVWVAGISDWSIPENWEHWVWDPKLGCVPIPGVPKVDDTVIIDNGGTAIITGSAQAENVQLDPGTLIQTSGSSVFFFLLLATQGTYELHQGVFNTDFVCDAGNFVQTGGNVTISEDISLFDKGTYELLGGTLNVRCIEVVGDVESEGATFVMNEGIINGITEDATLWVYGSKASLTGPGTFNINVVYESDEIYGKYGDEAVAISFLPNCLTEGGAYSITQLTPADFAGGDVSNLLESSVFDVSFDGSFCGEFTVTIPYDWFEFDALGVDETSLVILHETGPRTYERLDDTMVDVAYGTVSAKAHTFGKFAVRAKEFMVTFDDGPVLGNTKKIVDALKNIKVANGEPVRAGFFMVGERVRDNPNVVKAVADAKHFIGDHTQHHPDFNGWFADWSVEKIMLEISQCYYEIKKALDPNEPNNVNLRKIFRPPFLSVNQNVIEAADNLDFQIIMGAGKNENETTEDWWRSVKLVKQKASNLIESWHRDYPCVLVFHDRTSAALNITEIVEYLVKKKGFTLVHFDPQRLPKKPNSVVHHATNTIHQSETVTHTVSLDSTVSISTFNVSWEGSDLDLVLYKPDGTKIDSNSALVDPNIKYAERDMYEYYTVSDPNPGEWVMEVSGVNVPPEGEKYTIRVEADTNLILSAFTDKPEYGLTEQVNIKAQLANDGNSVTGALVMAKVQSPDGSIDNFTLYDDGTHGDQEPNDGFYTNAYNNTSVRGSYEIALSAIGEITGEQYERASSLTAMVGSIIHGNIDFNAYAVFADHWMEQNCTEPDWCDTADIDQSGEVDIFDLGILAEYWLEDTSP